MRRATVLAVLLAMLSAGTVASGAATTSASPRAEAGKRLNTLVKHTRKLPKKVVKRRHKLALVRLAKSAKRTARRRPCRSVRTLRTYRRQLKRVKRPRVKGRAPAAGSLRGQLESDTLAANVALLAVPRSRRCGGGATVTVAQATGDVLESDERHLRMRVSLPLPTFAAHQVGGTEYQQMFMDGTGESGAEGKPGLPVLTKFLGVPEGADVSVTVNDTDGYDLTGITLYPHQPEPVDQRVPGQPPISDFLEDPFVKSKRAYRSNRRLPAKPADAALLGNMRDLRIGGVEVSGGQYKARRGKLHVFTSIDVTVNFGGANQGTFGDATMMNSPWEAYFTRNYGRVVVNGATISDKLRVGPAKPWCGRDMLVVTSPTLKPAADNFANARKAAGYHPHVAVVGSDPGQIGTTLSAIQAYILGELNADCEVRPSYVVLFGDTSHVPTWLVPCTDGGDVAECDIASDLPYSLNFPSDLFADVMLGRIPAPDLASANAVVSKIVNYETAYPAPPGDDFYGHATVTAYFEPKYLCILNEGETGEPNCKSKNGPVTGHYELDYTNHKDTRGFTKTAESIQNAMTDDGIVTDRVYTTVDENVIPETYYDNTPIPLFLRRPAFGWNGTGADLLNHYNAGRSPDPPPRPRLAQRLGRSDAAQRRRAVDGERHQAAGRVRRGLLERTVRHPGQPELRRAPGDEARRRRVRRLRRHAREPDLGEQQHGLRLLRCHVPGAQAELRRRGADQAAGRRAVERQGLHGVEERGRVSVGGRHLPGALPLPPARRPVRAGVGEHAGGHRRDQDQRRADPDPDPRPRAGLPRCAWTSASRASPRPR